jgi:hypothetical protein
MKLKGKLIIVIIAISLMLVASIAISINQYKEYKLDKTADLEIIIGKNSEIKETEIKLQDMQTEINIWKIDYDSLFNSPNIQYEKIEIETIIHDTITVKDTLKSAKVAESTIQFKDIKWIRPVGKQDMIGLTTQQFAFIEVFIDELGKFRIKGKFQQKIIDTAIYKTANEIEIKDNLNFWIHVGFIGGLESLDFYSGFQTAFKEKWSMSSISNFRKEENFKIGLFGGFKFY